MMTRCRRSIIAFAMALVSGSCGNNISNPVTQATGGLGNSTANTASQTAPGQCNNIPATSSDRAVCTQCYALVLTLQCPGQTDPSQCVDPNTRADFTNFVNTCISTSDQAGFLCYKLCPAGEILTPTNCSCVPTNG